MRLDSPPRGRRRATHAMHSVAPERRLNVDPAVSLHLFSRLAMDATDRPSIAAARDEIAAKEGKLHILVNK